MSGYRQKTIQAYQDIFENYLQKRLGSDNDSNWLYQKFIELVPGNQILEVGFGPGFDAQRFVNDGFKYTGVEPVSKFCKLVKNKVPQATIIKQDILKTKFPQQSFDGIYALASILHFNDADIVKLLNYFHQWLKKDGILFISLKEGDGTEIRNEGRFFNLFTKERFLTLTSPFFILINYSTNSPKEYNTGKETWLNFYFKKTDE